MAEPYGYTAPAVDVFAVAVSIVIMFFASPPWKQARPTDSYFQWVQSNGLSALAKSWRKSMPSAVSDLLGRMLRANAEHRPSVEECLGHSCFVALRSAPVAMRQPSLCREEAPRLAGDCYREPEWVCRSAGFSEDVPPVDFDVMMGDPYHDMGELSGATCQEWQQLLCDAPPPLALLREDKTEIEEMDAAFWALQAQEAK